MLCYVVIPSEQSKLTSVQTVFRMCMALAWPDSYASGDTRIEEVEEGNYPMYIITNPDLHDTNSELTPFLIITSFGPEKLLLMFGDLAADGSLEHQMVPILKMIDLGECQRERTRGQVLQIPQQVKIWTRPLSNRCTCCSEQEWLNKTSDSIATLLSFHIETLCERGARTSPNDVPLDPELQVLADMTSMEQVDIRRLSEVVIDAVATRTESWYQTKHPGLDASIESDTSVQELVRSVFFDADETFTRIF
ncbi:hypothetical protein PG995_010112 [Apiospora arundinis]|uniref:Uncharacterized protein n=1 Tax=Apiospora arundinis TaxID=335852 RepID=A0ABR2IT56_9PEZI